MATPIKEGDKASCLDEATGSEDVFIERKGASRVNLDTAGGTISGPGNPTVLVNGDPISIVGDIISSHGSGNHASAKTESEGSTVNVG